MTSIRPAAVLRETDAASASAISTWFRTWWWRRVFYFLMVLGSLGLVAFCWWYRTPDTTPDIGSWNPVSRALYTLLDSLHDFIQWTRRVTSSPA